MADQPPLEQAPPAARRFGSVLRTWRQKRGLSQRQLADQVTYSKETIAKVELGERWAGLDFAKRCDTVLDTGGELARLVPEVEAERRASDGRRRRDPAPATQDGHTEVERSLRQAFHHASSDAAAPPAHLLAAADEVRQMVDDLLDDGSAPASRLDRLEANVARHARNALTVAPAEMICRLNLDIIDAHHVARTRKRKTDRQRVRAVLARLAALTADEMSVLGHVHAARAWHATAVTAADTTGDIALRADLRTLAALLPLYHGDPTTAANLARRARCLAEGTRCLTTGLAPMLEALAWAKAGHPDRARDALAVARRAYDHTGPAQQAESVFGFSPRRRLFYEGRLLTILADYEAAWSAHRQALQMYPDNVVGDPTLIYLDRAAALIGTRQPEDAAELVIATMLSLPPPHRSRIFVSAAGAVINAVAPAARRLPAVRACRDVLTELQGSALDGDRLPVPHPSGA
jgi:transcriptional regulator with XRE-family HTH domain